MATLLDDLSNIARKLDLYSYLEEKAVRVVEAAKAGGAIHYGNLNLKTDLGGALCELESFLEQQGFCWCAHCGCITKRGANEPCDCEEEE